MLDNLSITDKWAQVDKRMTFKPRFEWAFLIYHNDYYHRLRTIDNLQGHLQAGFPRRWT